MTMDCNEKMGWSRTAKHLITMAVVGIEKDDNNDDDDEAIVYIKKSQKREWLKDMLENEARNTIIETLNTNYEAMQSLNNLTLITLYDVEDIIRIVHYRMCLKYSIGGRNAKKNF